MKAQHYAEAVYLASKDANDVEIDALSSRLCALLREKGHMALLPAIVRELEKIQKKRGRLQETIIRVSKESDVLKFQTEIARAVREMNAMDLPQKVEVDDTLIGGYEVTAHGMRLDRSYKRSLLTLYTNLLTNNV
jgi:F0F1-type ATP synthase delta subunit